MADLHIESVSKLIKGLKNSKVPGPDDIKKEQLPVNIPLAAITLAQIFQYSVNNGWEKLMSFQFIRREIKAILVTTGQYFS